MGADAPTASEQKEEPLDRKHGSWRHPVNSVPRDQEYRTGTGARSQLLQCEATGFQALFVSVAGMTASLWRIPL